MRCVADNDGGGALTAAAAWAARGGGDLSAAGVAGVTAGGSGDLGINTFSDTASSGGWTVSVASDDSEDEKYQ